MGKLSLRQIFFGMLMLAVGLSIWRLPDGRWTDVPLGALSVAFLVSLLRSTAGARRMAVGHPDLSREQRWGLRILAWAWFVTAAMLAIALVLTQQASAIAANSEQTDFLSFVDVAALPRDLTILAMLVAIGLQPTIGSKVPPTAPRRSYKSLALLCTLLAIIVFWINHLLVWFLVYIAVSNIEAAQAPRFLSPELQVNAAVRLHRFTLASFIGLAVVVGNVMWLAGAVKCWKQPWTRRFFALLLAAGLAAECGVASWIAIVGLWQLSPQFYETVPARPASVIAIVGALLLLGSGAFAWRLLAHASQVPFAPGNRERRVPFHESAWAGLWLAIVALACTADPMIERIREIAQSPFGVVNRIDWDTCAYVLTEKPAQLIGVAAVIGGLTHAWLVWRRRHLPLANTVPGIEPALYLATLVSLATLVLFAAPIVAGACFSSWAL